MFFKKQIIEMIYNYFNKNHNIRAQIIELIETIFFEIFHIKYQIDQYPIIIKNNFEYIKHKLFNVNILTLYERIFKTALVEGLIRLEDYKFLMNFIFDLIETSNSKIYNADYKFFAILSILKAFNKELPRVALVKFYYILLTPKAFIEVILKYDEIQKKKIANNNILSYSLLTPEIYFVAEMQGPYEINIENILLNLKNLGFIQLIYKGNKKLSKITQNGEKHLENLLNSEKIYRKLHNNTLELAFRFRDWSGIQIESFLKKYVLKDFDKYKKGEVMLQ